VENARITRVEWARLEGTRPRSAGSNARLGEHGLYVRPGVARITLDDGTTGIGPSRATREQVEPFVGMTLAEAFGVDAKSGRIGAADVALPIDFPLWDLAAKRAGKPVYALAAELTGAPAPAEPFDVRAYDTSLYIDDLHLADEAAAAALIADEARQGYERGHRAFKIKVGRGARHLPLESGTRRDIAVIHAVRSAVGADAPLMIDANNGYNLNLTKRVLAETADCHLHWIEEAFHEDVVLYRDMREWLARENLPILIADGEGQASPTLLDWVREGAIDVVQYDISGHGFTRWIRTGRLLDSWGARSAAHHYGGFFGNFVSGHLAGAVHGFTAVEWDEATVPGVDTSRYRVREGRVTLPSVPGFGLEYDETALGRAVAETGFIVG
jgi:L-alanine-DL-glutamate epimerase-like enolase superfamily enzyme